MVRSVGADLEERFAELVGYRIRPVGKADSPVARANRALAVGFATASRPGYRRWTTLPTIRGWRDRGTVATIRADLLRRSGRLPEAAQWYRIALTHNGSAPAREFLQR